MIRNLIRKGTITQIYNQEGIIDAQVTSLDSDSPEDVTLWLPYGMNACPPLGSEVVILALFGHLEDKIAFPVNSLEAPILKVGETILYNHFGSSIYLKENGDIDLVATKDVNVTAAGDINANAVNINATASTAATITAPTITLDGNVVITGTLQVDGDSTLTGTGTSIAGKVFLSHSHSGVTAGGANTGGVT